MKYLYIIILFLLSYSCGNSPINKTTALNEQRNSLNDSALNLMFKFQRNNDTSLIEKALLLNDSVLAIDTNKEFEFHTLHLRGQILYCLGRYKESFELAGKLISMNECDVDRLIYNGVKYRMDGKNDSMQYCLETALVKCDSILADSQDVFIAIKIAEIYLIMNKKEEIKKMVEKLKIKYPGKTEELTLIFDGVADMEKYLSNLFNN